MELLQANLRFLDNEYSNNETITWSKFYSDPTGNSKSVVLLSQSDFDHGTLRIRHPCKLKLIEDIQFNPNRPTFNPDGTLNPSRSKDWFPFAGQTNADDYLTGDAANGYRLGFFAAIAIETSNVILDLNGFTISQHPEHALMQRFFSVLELADQPFRSSQGPANFGASISVSSNVWIKNGRIGLSSHHGIHGNSCQNIWMSDLVFKENEVASISINGGKVILVERCEDRGRRQGIPVLGSWSALRFATLFADKLSSLTSFSEIVAPALTAAKLDIKRVFDQVIVTNNGAIDNTGSNTDLSYLKNDSGFVDGPAYGMVFHPEGVAVGAFQNCVKHQTGTITIKESVIRDVVNASIEIPSFSKADGTGNQVDTVGSVIQYLNGLIDSSGKYLGTSLSNLQFALASLKEANPSSTMFFGTLSIDPDLLAWTKDASMTLEISGDKSQAILKNGGGSTVSTYQIRYNGDSMHHVLKGAIGLRIEGATNVVMKNVTVSKIESRGRLGAGSYIKGHENQEDMVGYWGTVVHGIRASGCSDIDMSGIIATDISSAKGPATGIGIHHCTSVCVRSANIRAITGGSDGLFGIEDTNGMPNPFPIATGFNIQNSTCIKLYQLFTNGISHSCPLYDPRPVQLDCDSVQKIMT